MTSTGHFFPAISMKSAVKPSITKIQGVDRNEPRNHRKKTRYNMKRRELPIVVFTRHDCFISFLQIAHLYLIISRVALKKIDIVRAI